MTLLPSGVKVHLAFYRACCGRTGVVRFAEPPPMTIARGQNNWAFRPRGGISHMTKG